MIGLWGRDPHWQSLLRQEGVCFDTDAQGELAGVRVLILDRRPEKVDARPVRDYVEQGGCVVASAAHAQSVWPELRLQQTRICWIASDGRSPLFRNVGIVDLHTCGWRVSDATDGAMDSGSPAVSVTRQGRGWRILLPFDVASVLTDHSAGPKRFWADAPRFPYDTVARVSRGDVRRLVANCLRFLLARQGLPYVRLSHVPADSAGAFGFRVDTDFGPHASIRAVAELAERVGMKFSWYVNARSHAPYLATLQQYAQQGQDVQLHCYRHTVYPDFERNRRNFAQGMDIMHKAGMRPVGVVAPYGEWNLSLNRTFSDLGFEYSSEFCFAYDDLPSTPVVTNPVTDVQDPDSAGVLQVPVHPICIGRLAAARASRGQMERYHQRIIDTQLARLEPCFLYDHPARIAEYQDVLAGVLNYGLARSSRQVTLTEYARWWRRRENVRYAVRAVASRLDLDVKSAAADVRLVVEREGSYALEQLQSGRLDLDALRWRPLPASEGFGPAWLATRRPDLRLTLSDRLRRVRKTLQGHRS